MKRSMFGAYVKGSNDAVEFYQKAFGATVKNAHKNEDGTYMHAELDIFGQVFTVTEALPEWGERVAGNTMQINLHMGEGNEEAVKRAYNVLKEGAAPNNPMHNSLGECLFSPLMFGLIDKFGVNWCVFI